MEITKEYLQKRSDELFTVNKLLDAAQEMLIKTIIELEKNCIPMIDDED